MCNYCPGSLVLLLHPWPLPCHWHLACSQNLSLLSGVPQTSSMLQLWPVKMWLQLHVCCSVSARGIRHTLVQSRLGSWHLRCSVPVWVNQHMLTCNITVESALLERSSLSDSCCRHLAYAGRCTKFEYHSQLLPLWQQTSA